MAAPAPAGLDMLLELIYQEGYEIYIQFRFKIETLVWQTVV